MFASIIFIFNRLLEIVTLIPILGMLVSTQIQHLGVGKS